jgi:hypothetical protein
MALPTVMSQGTRVIWWAGYQPPVPPPAISGPTIIPPNYTTGVAPIPGNICGSPPPYPGMVGVGPFTGLCQQPGSGAPDFIGSTAIVFDGRGAPFLVGLGVNATTWVSGGSLLSVAHWQFVDLGA